MSDYDSHRGNFILDLKAIERPRSSSTDIRARKAMATSGTLLKSLTSAEHEFLAEESPIVIIPSEDHQAFRFISGTFGPFSSGMPCMVPVWLAITLRKKGKCTIKIPGWMTVPSLTETLAQERSSNVLSAMPFHYMEVSQLLLNYAREDIESPDQVGALLKDLENIRMDRIRMGIASVAESIQRSEAVVFADLENVGSLEIFTIKRFFLNAMDSFFKLCPPAYDDTSASAGSVFGSSDASAEPAVAGRRLRRFRDASTDNS